MTELDILAKYHTKWVNMTLKIGGCQDSEDIVQEMYLKILKGGYENKVITNGEPNDVYIWKMLHSLTMDLIKLKSKYTKVELSNVSNIEEENEEPNEKAIKAYKIADKLPWYNRKLLSLHIDENKSMHKISRETNISFWHIYRDISNSKEFIKKEL